MKKEFFVTQRTLACLMALITLLVFTGCTFNKEQQASGTSATAEQELTTEDIVSEILNDSMLPISAEERVLKYPEMQDINYQPMQEHEYFTFLSDEGKMYYDALFKYNCKFECLHVFTGQDRSSWQAIDTAKQFCNLDHPETKLLDSKIYSYITKYSNTIRTELMAIYSEGEDLSDYSSQKAKYDEKISKIDNEIADLVATVKAEDDLITKYRLIFDYLTTTVEYDSEEFESVKSGNGMLSKDNYNLYNALVRKKAVCLGISDAFKYICQKCNLECVTIIGDLDSTKDKNYCHAWNLVPMYGDWYLVDCTFSLKTSDEEISSLYWDYDEERNVATLKARPDYFMNKDISIEGRTPLTGLATLGGEEPIYTDTFGYPSSKYEESNSYSTPTITDRIDDFSAEPKTIHTAEGLTFTCNDNYYLAPSTTGVAFALTSNSFDALMNGDSSVNEGISISTNGKIVGALGFSYNNLCRIETYDAVSNVDWVFEDSETGDSCCNFTLLVEYQNKIYKEYFWYSGA